MDFDHHWVDGATLVPDPALYFGFLYEIHELDTGRLYVGIKQYWFSNGTVKRRVMDKQSSKWQEHAWRPSDWRSYTGSSKKLNVEVGLKGKDNYEFRIIGQYPCSRTLRYAEANYLHKVDALVAKDQEGEYVYYNEAIQDIKFRPPEGGMSDTHQAKLSAHLTTPKNRARIAEGKRKGGDYGAKTYKGSPCKNCGGTVRYVSAKSCKVCAKARAQAKRDKEAQNVIDP